MMMMMMISQPRNEALRLILVNLMMITSHLILMRRSNRCSVVWVQGQILKLKKMSGL